MESEEEKVQGEKVSEILETRREKKMKRNVK